MKKALFLIILTLNLLGKDLYLWHIKDIRDYISKHYLNTLTNIDNYLSNDYTTHNDQIYKNRLYMITSLQINKNQIKPSLYLHSNLHLPKTQKKLYLVFDKYSDEIRYKDQTYENQNDKNSKQDTKFNIGLKYFFIKKDNKNLYTQFGIKLHSPLKFYFKLGGDKELNFNTWTLNLENNFYYYLTKDGFIPSLLLSIKKPINSNFTFKNYYELLYKSDTNLLSLISSVRVYHNIDKRQMLIYEFYFNALANQNCTFCSNLYSINTTYTNKLKPWLYIDLIPKLDFYKDSSFNPSFAFIINFRTIFSK